MLLSAGCQHESSKSLLGPIEHLATRTYFNITYSSIYHTNGDKVLMCIISGRYGEMPPPTYPHAASHRRPPPMGPDPNTCHSPTPLPILTPSSQPNHPSTSTKRQLGLSALSHMALVSYTQCDAHAAYGSIAWSNPSFTITFQDPDPPTWLSPNPPPPPLCPP